MLISNTSQLALTVLDPQARAAYAAQPFVWRALNEAALPRERTAREALLADLEGLLRRGDLGAFTLIPENLASNYLVDIGNGQRISRKVYVRHPAAPDQLIVAGGVGQVRPDADGARLTLETPLVGATLHGTFPDLPRSAMSAAHPTPQKGLESRPNVDPLGALSVGVAERKYANAAALSDTRYPVISNLAWGTIGEGGAAFYVYALPSDARMATDLLQGEDPAQAVAALGAYLAVGQRFMRALRALHEAGYIHNQPHQGNLYTYSRGRIVVADLDSLQELAPFSTMCSEGDTLSPRAFGVLVNVQVAACSIAHLAWLEHLGGWLRRGQTEGLERLDTLYADIVIALVRGYLPGLAEGACTAFREQARRYCAGLFTRGRAGTARLTGAEAYEEDVWGLLFTRILLDTDWCTCFGARYLAKDMDGELYTDLMISQRAQRAMSAYRLPFVRRRTPQGGA